MQNLILKNSTEEDRSPAISFLVESGECVLEGRSQMQNPFEFYEPLIEWVENYFTKFDKKTLKFILKLNYYNTGSSKMLIDLLEILQKNKDSGQNLLLFFPPNWSL